MYKGANVVFISVVYKDKGKGVDTIYGLNADGLPCIWNPFGGGSWVAPYRG